MDVYTHSSTDYILNTNVKENNIELINSIDSIPVISTLTDLIRELHKVFESDSVNIEYVKYLMKSYKSNPSDWKKYAKFDRYRYTRNLVDEGNGKFNLMLLCWGEGHGSAIHDHADAHCFMKMLDGELEEIRFDWPDDSHNIDTVNDCNIIGNLNLNTTLDDSSLMREKGRSRLLKNEVCYINDSLGLHRVENPSHTNTAVSMHLYCPPFKSCSVFNQQTGKRTLCPVTFWSKYGQKRQREIQDDRVPEDN